MPLAFGVYYYPSAEGLNFFALFIIFVLLSYASLSFLSPWLWLMISVIGFYLFFGIRELKFVDRRRAYLIFLFLLFSVALAGFMTGASAFWLILPLVLFFGSASFFELFLDTKTPKRFYLIAGVYALIVTQFSWAVFWLPIALLPAFIVLLVVALSLLHIFFASFQGALSLRLVMLHLAAVVFMFLLSPLLSYN